MTDQATPAKVRLTDGLGAWLPIETAPKDSKARLVWVPENRCIFCVSWTDGNCGPGDEGDRPGWEIFGGGDRAYLRDGRATHWMPLPAPPQSA